MPIVLLIGLSVLQWALLFFGRQAVANAAIEGARAGSVAHADDAALERGVARGLLPWLYGSTGPEDHAVNLARALDNLRTGRAQGWADWRRIAPTQASFADWAEPARDANGLPVPGLLEIPNDNLSLRAGMRQPASGTSGQRAGEPIGNASGQTLNDANLLKIELTYGVPLVVPLVGRMAAWVMRIVDACESAAARPSSASTASSSASASSGGPRAMRLGAVDLGQPTPSPASRAWTCAHYDARGADGAPRPRWPIRVSATIRMQSPARMPAASPSGVSAPQAAASLGLGAFDEGLSGRPPSIDKVNPNGADAVRDGSVDRAPGFLKIGADRELPPPPDICP